MQTCMVYVYGVPTGRTEWTREESNAYGCCGPSTTNRAYFTRAERIEWLKEYAEELENEAKGVRERIEELQKA